MLIRVMSHHSRVRLRADIRCSYPVQNRYSFISRTVCAAICKCCFKLLVRLSLARREADGLPTESDARATCLKGVPA